MVNSLISLLSFVQLALLVSASPAQDRMVHKRQSSSGAITTSQRIPATNAMLGKVNTQTSINAGVNYWLSGFSTHNTFGNLDVAGNLIISQTDSIVKPYGGMTANFVGSNPQNGNLNIRSGGSILLNDVEAVSAPTYDWYLETMSNSGSMQWCGRGDTGGSTYQLYCESNCVNNGAVTFEQVKGNLGTAMVWRNDVLTPSSTTPSQTITNNGAFIMRSARVDFVQNFKGTGCWVIDNKAIMYLQDGVGAFQNPAFGPSLNGQSISFTDATGILHMDTAVYSKNSNFGANIYGYQAGNSIEFYELIKSQSYSGSTLTVTMVSGNSVKLNIGAGYDASKFVVKNNRTFYANFNAVQYTGSAPGSSAPSVCNQNVAVCSALTGFPSTSSSSTAAPSSTTASSSTVAPSSTVSSSTQAPSSTAVSSSTQAPSSSVGSSASATASSTSTSSAPVCSTTATFQQTQSNFTAPVPRGHYGEGTTSGAAASDPSYITYKIVKSAQECQDFCASISSCRFANVYQDLYPDGETPVDLTPETQAKYVKGNLSCAVFSKCLPDSAFTNFALQNDPSYITDSYGFCRGDSCQ